MRKIWFEEMFRLSAVVGAGLCAGWFAGSAVMPSASATHVAVPAPVMSRAELAPTQILALAPAAPALIADQGGAGSRPGACSLDPRDYADDTPIGAPTAPGHKKKRGVACG